MKARINKLERMIADHNGEIVALRKFRHDTNSHLNNHEGKLYIIEGQQKTMVDELKLIRTDIREWIDKTNNLLNWQLSIKFMLIGGAGVGTVMVGGVIGIAKLYLVYMK